MSDLRSPPEDSDADREALLTHLKKLGLTSDDALVRMSSKSTEEFQAFIDGLRDTKNELQEHCHQLITIKDVVEKYLGRLISEILDGRDVVELLQRGVQLYPSLNFIRWMVGDGERDVAELVKDSDLDGEYVLPILYRWKYEYKPLNNVWWELERREEGRVNSWTDIIVDRYYGDLRRMPQVSIKLMSKNRVLWSAREDVDDLSGLAAALLRIALRACMEPRENIESIFVDNMRDVIVEIDKIIEEMKTLRLLNPHNISEDLTDTQ